MRRLLFLLTMCSLACSAGAEVIRCTDEAGNVSYTDSACPAGARPVGRVAIPPASVQPPAHDTAAGPRPPQTASLDPTPPPVPAGPTIIDTRISATDVGRSEDSRWNSRGDDPPMLVDNGYFYPGVSRPPRPPRDMRPRIRSCDSRTCEDTQGNHFNRTTGQLDRYRSIDGRTCQPVGSTVVCR